MQAPQTNGGRTIRAVQMRSAPAEARVVAEVEGFLARVADEEVEVGPITEDESDFEGAFRSGGREARGFDPWRSDAARQPHPHQKRGDAVSGSA